MIKKWTKILPYGIVMWFCRKMSGHYGTFKDGKEYKIRYFQIDEGELVCFSEELQKIFDERREKERQTKLDKKLQKVLRKTSADYELDKELKEYYKDVIQREKEEQMYED